MDPQIIGVAGVMLATIVEVFKRVIPPRRRSEPLVQFGVFAGVWVLAYAMAVLIALFLTVPARSPISPEVVGATASIAGVAIASWNSVKNIRRLLRIWRWG